MYRVFMRIEDSRAELDVLSIELKSFLSKRLRKGRDYVYNYNYETNEHSLYFRGLWSMFIPSDMDKQHALFALKNNEKWEKIDDEILNREINKFIETVSLPVKPETNEDKYNWMLATAVRSKNFSGNDGRIVLDNPSILNYVEESNAFIGLFSILEDDYIDIKVPPSNWFAIEEESMKIRIWNPKFDRPEMLIPEAQRNIRTCMHIDFHLKTPHTFIYPDDLSQMRHVATNIIKDWKQEKKLRDGGAAIVERICERLHVLSGGLQVRKLAALGNVYPMYNEDITIKRENEVTVLLAMFEEIYNDVNNKFNTILQKVFNDDRYIYFPIELYNAYLLLDEKPFFKSILSLPRVLTEDWSSYKIKTEGNNYVNWSLRPHGEDRVMDEIAKGTKISTSTVRVREIGRSKLRVKDIYRFKHDRPMIVNRLTEGEMETLKDNARERYQIQTSRASIHFNAIARARFFFNEAIENEIEFLREDNKNVVAKLARVEHLFLFAGSNRKYKYVDNNEDDDVVSSNTSTVITDDELAKNEKAYNNSTPKLLSIYYYLINSVIIGGTEIERILMNDGESLCFLGAISEPAREILHELHKAGDRNVKIMGFGDEAVSPNVRTTIPINNLKNISATFLISDINQNEQQLDFEQMVELTMEILKQCVRSSLNAAIKLNHPSLYLVNEMSRYLYDNVSKRVYTSIVKVSGQNPFTNEAFFVYKIEEIEKEERYYGVRETIICRNYNSNVSEIQRAYVPGMLNNINTSELDSLYVDLVSLQVGKEELLKTMGTMSKCMSEISSYKIREDREIYALFGRMSGERILLDQRGAESYTNLANVRRAIPSGMGKNDGKTVEMSRYLQMDWTLLHKQACYYRARNELTARGLYTDKNKIVSVGGRNLTDIRMVPINHEYVIFDPNSEGIEMGHKDIDIRLQTFNISDMGSYENDSMYLFMFVIMNEPDGTSTSKDDQMEKIRTMARAVRNNRNVTCVFNAYTGLTLDAFEKSNITDGVRLSREERRMTFGDHKMAYVLENDEILNVANEEGINGVIIYPSMDDVSSAQMSEAILIKGLRSVHLITALMSTPIVIYYQ
ncbi:Cypovirus VP4 [Hubei lepidoptera virus 3]|uniref:Cypovirus VP4 n=1 Tax=Hubei lepidoptera virus 3 TaxID=1922905 RepID=UPI0009094092|nr:Cypovirus VP4 [Hubei lepidoptera virus 3]APG79096.1 Cypovirus VP4 [Hubei lepidoptera virus 3]